jgi:hypothetical protein
MNKKNRHIKTKDYNKTNEMKLCKFYQIQYIKNLPLQFSIFNFDFWQDEVSMESLDGLQLLNCVIKESLRLYPPAVTLLRKCEENDMVIN